MAEFLIEVCSYAKSYDLRTEAVRDPVTGRVTGERQVPVSTMVPVGFRTSRMEFADRQAALQWCEERSTPEREYRLADDEDDAPWGADAAGEAKADADAASNGPGVLWPPR